MPNNIEVNDPQILKGFKVKTKPRNFGRSAMEISRYRQRRSANIGIYMSLLILAAVVLFVMAYKGLI